jgi:hypothetical protein
VYFLFKEILPTKQNITPTWRLCHGPPPKVRLSIPLLCFLRTCKSFDCINPTRSWWHEIWTDRNITCTMVAAMAIQFIQSLNNACSRITIIRVSANRYSFFLMIVILTTNIEFVPACVCECVLVHLFWKKNVGFEKNIRDERTRTRRSWQNIYLQEYDHGVDKIKYAIAHWKLSGNMDAQPHVSFLV